ncbi:protein SOSEKI 2 isoform X2 [Diospyros lotus]|uniref:protein SOSEKI 2 isoform X2 n=1 Tax=Diospyros lotus TaxID=55363 RepID=UPI002251646F|nr:protein SOSEKI 2 isoform X2 [Diospyros lotus]
MMSTQRREPEMEARGRRPRAETSPESTAKVAVKPRLQLNKAIFRKVQVVYYLSRNGLLEHPHFMEVTHLAHQHLRLKDVMDRLTALRGKGMPSLYSWSCKRSYKNGYVWNDLSENDIIYPSEGAEYVLKGSELIEGCSEKFQKLQLGGEVLVVPGTSFRHKRRPEAAKRRSESEPEEEDDGEEEEEEEVEDKTSYTTSSMNSRCSRGVSTEDNELEQEETAHKNHPSPPSTTSSTVSDKANESNNASKRFEDGDPVAAESLTGRNSVLLQLFSCGGSTSFRGKSVPVPLVNPPPPPCGAARKSTGASLQKVVVSKTAAAAAGVEADMIRCMSENPRFGNLQAEEKEYFSGSIVEAMAEERAQLQPLGLKRSSSYNEERGRSQEDGEGGMKEEIAERKRETSGKMTGKCIPRKAATSKHSKK